MKTFKTILSIALTVLDIIIALQIIKKLKEDKDIICFTPDDDE